MMLTPDRWGEVPAKTVRTIRKATQVQLNAWLVRFVHAQSIEDVLAWISTHHGSTNAQHSHLAASNSDEHLSVIGAGVR